MSKPVKMIRNVTPGPCNAFPRIWAAIFGCTGRGTFLRWDAPTTMHGRATAEYACEGCRCAWNLSRSLGNSDGPAHQDFLAQAQELAGVENYRYHASVRAGGRPVLREGGRSTGAPLAPLAPFSERWPMLRPRRPEQARRFF